MTRTARDAYSLVEFLVVTAIIGVLSSLLVPAVQKARDTAYQAHCQNNLRQVALALQQFHEIKLTLPAGWRSGRQKSEFGQFTSWLVPLLPFVEQGALASTVASEFARSSIPFADPPHIGLGATVSMFGCPLDVRVSEPQLAVLSKKKVGLTSYLGVSGTRTRDANGVLFADSRISLGDIVDGTSCTLLTGERPPSSDFQYGWWYAGYGLRLDGSADQILGVHEVNQPFARFSGCPAGRYHYAPGRLENMCDALHFWSLHNGGANFLFCDGSVRFLPYATESILPALATRSGGESVQTPD